VGELHIDVTVRGDRVFLTGVVPSAERREAIAEVVGNVAEGREVHNHVTVEGISGSPEVESLG
jgi:osmotically-inducible protein OsmY